MLRLFKGVLIRIFIIKKRGEQRIMDNKKSIGISSRKSKGRELQKWVTKMIGDLIEKPFGKDKNSAIKLNQILLEAFGEPQIYRIDHFLGKETVQNILFFRFANTIFEPIWNQKFIEYVEITASETLGVENRAIFYEETG